MDQIFWQICELEDDSKSFTEFTVSSVPENWYVTINGRLNCYWPKTNARQKIQSRTFPKEGKNWTTFKCRILMDKARFRTYESAREAEVIAQNRSTMLDSSMDFDVSSMIAVESDCDTNATSDDIVEKDSFSTVEEEEDIQAENDSIDCNSTMNFEVSLMKMDSVDDVIVGNDSFKYNKETVQGGPYCSGKGFVKSSYVGQTSDDWNISEISEYASQFKSNSNEFLTSTLLDEFEVVREWEVDYAKKIRSISSNIERKVSLFIADVNNDLNQLQEVVKQNKIKPESMETIDSPIDPEWENAASEDSFQSEQIQMNNPASDETFYVYESTAQSLENNSTRKDNPNAALKKIKILNIQNIHSPIAITQRATSNNQILDQVTVNNAILNVIPFAQQVADDNDGIQMLDQAAFDNAILNPIPVPQQVADDNDDMQILDQAAFDNAILNPIPVPQQVADDNDDMQILDQAAFDNAILNDEAPDAHDASKSDDKVIRLPVTFTVDFDQNEDLLEQYASLGDALTEDLLPLKHEDEKIYMNRTISKVFSENFFVDLVSWKKEKNRVSVKHSNTLQCWKESYAKMFPPDVDNKKFVAHFRRVKSAIRAARNEKAKREEKEKAKRKIKEKCFKK